MQTAAAPAAVGPYSQAITQDGWLFASGQIPLDPATGQLVAGDIETQTRQVIANLSAVLAAGGSSIDRVVKVTIYLTDLTHFTRVNAVYAEQFGHAAPARATVQVAALPLGAQIEMDLVARCN